MDGSVAEPSRGVTVRRCRHGVMAFLTNDEYVGRSLDRYGEFSEVEVRLLRELVPTSGVVVDAGANVGTHTLPLARRVGAGGRVLAFEPQRPLYLLLCANIALNGLWQADPVRAALAATAGTIMVPELDLDRSYNFAGVGLGGWREGEAVQTMSVDDHELARCDLIKVDVEGMELEVLQGAAATIRRDRPILYVENDREDRASDLIEHLLGLDYNLYWHLPPLFNPQNFRAEESDVFGGLVSLNMLGLPVESPLDPPMGSGSLRRVSSPSDRAL